MKTSKQRLAGVLAAILGSVSTLPSSAWTLPNEEQTRQDADGPPATEDPDAAQLFQENCARCHGETGDGKGWTDLDRPARSFKDGGFSYGNTPEALFRTISVGIPGTPMPGFDSSNTEAERRALAEYVITLGPEIREVTESETILAVLDRPQVVRGKLPPIAEGVVEHARGLLIGTTDGFTFEYRTDDVRLLGVRLGGFVKRSDWTGRGGSALEPLGLVVHLMERGKPESTFVDPAGEPLTAGLSGTWILGGEAGVAYTLATADGRHVATVTESCVAATRTLATGFSRRFHVVDQQAPFRLRLPTGGESVDTFEERGIAWRIWRREDGRFEGFGIAGAEDGRLSRAEDAQWELTTHHFVFTEWNDETREKWLAEETR